jgi:hypothetical protein
LDSLSRFIYIHIPLYPQFQNSVGTLLAKDSIILNLDVIVLTETHLNKKWQQCWYTFDHITKCTRYGLSVYIKESFPYSLLQLDTSIQYLAIKLFDRISCVIVYNLPRHQQNFIQNMKDNIIPFMSESCLVMGDFNIHCIILILYIYRRQPCSLNV